MTDIQCLEHKAAGGETGGPPQNSRKFHPPAYQNPPQNPTKSYKGEGR